MDDTSYDGHDELYHHAKFGKIVQHAPAVGAKMWCLFVFLFLFFCHAPGPERRAFEGGIVRIRIVLPFIGRFRRGLQFFFRKGLHFKTRYIVHTFVARWRHNLREIAVKNCEKSKNRRKSFFFEPLYTGWIVVVHLYCGFPLCRHNRAPNLEPRFLVNFVPV